MRYGQPEHQQVLLRLWQLAIVCNMFVLQPSQPPLREVLRLVRTQARGERVEESTETPRSAPSRRFSMALVWLRHWGRALQRMPSLSDRAFGFAFHTSSDTLFNHVHDHGFSSRHPAKSQIKDKQERARTCFAKFNEEMEPRAGFGPATFRLLGIPLTRRMLSSSGS